MEGEISGPVIRSMVRTHPAPQLWLHSSRETWIWLMAETTVRMPIIMYLVIYAAIRIQAVL